jgi:hypothetical protein
MTCLAFSTGNPLGVVQRCHARNWMPEFARILRLYRGEHLEKREKQQLRSEYLAEWDGIWRAEG